jgi:hypothetical protein
VLHRNGSTEPPVDLRGRLYVEYDSPTKPGGGAGEIASQLRNKFKTIDALEQLLVNRPARYLSLTYLRQKLPRLQLSSEEMERLCKAFPTVEELARAKADEMEKRAALDHTTAKIIEVMTREL